MKSLTTSTFPTTATKYVLFFMLLVVQGMIPGSVYGQKNIEVKEQSVEMSPGSQTGYTIFPEDAERKEIDDIVKDLFGEVQKKPDI